MQRTTHGSLNSKGRKVTLRKGAMTATLVNVGSFRLSLYCFLGAHMKLRRPPGSVYCSWTKLKF